MNFVYQNPLEESNIQLTDFGDPRSLGVLKEKQFYKIIWVKDQTTGMTVDGCSLELKKNQVIFCTPLNFIHIPAGCKAIIGIIFNREFYCIRDNDEEVSCNGFLFYGSSQPVIISLDENEQDDFAMIYRIFREEFKHRNKSQGEMIRAMLKRLIIKGTRLAIKENVKDDLPGDKYDLIRKFHILVEKNFKKRHQVNEYAALLCKSPKTIANVFYKYSDKTPLTVINERILLEARSFYFQTGPQNKLHLNLVLKNRAISQNSLRQIPIVPPSNLRKRLFQKNKGRIYHTKGIIFIVPTPPQKYVYINML